MKWHTIRKFLNPFIPEFLTWTHPSFIPEFELIHYCEQGFQSKHNNKMASSVDPDETAHYEPSHQNLQSLKRYLYWSVGMKGSIHLCSCVQTKKTLSSLFVNTGRQQSARVRSADGQIGGAFADFRDIQVSRYTFFLVSPWKCMLWSVSMRCF